MAAITANTLDPTALHKALERAIGTVVAVPASVLEPMLCAVLARGHVLLEGKPGIGKTLLARTFAQCIDCDFRRIQFTNDLMPGDIVGASVWRPSVESFSFVPGPMFANVVLADEINRTSPRTLSCLLEAMESGTVSIDGKTHQIAKPFLVLATLNPVEFHGTYPHRRRRLIDFSRESRWVTPSLRKNARSTQVATQKRPSPKCTAF